MILQGAISPAVGKKHNSFQSLKRCISQVIYIVYWALVSEFECLKNKAAAHGAVAGRALLLAIKAR